MFCYRRFFAASAVVLALAAAPAYAAPKITLQLSDALVTIVDNKPVVSPVNRPVKAGETLRWTIVARNVGSTAALKVQPVGKVPAATSFARLVSAPQGSAVEYSLDDKTWSAHPTITVMEHGKPVVKPAPLESYREIRWTLANALAPKTAATFVYEVRVR